MELNVSRQELEDIIEFAETNEAVADALRKLMTVYLLSKDNEPNVTVKVTKNRFKSAEEEVAALNRLKDIRYGL